MSAAPVFLAEHHHAASEGASVDVQSKLSGDFADVEANLHQFYLDSAHHKGLNNYLSGADQSYYIPAFSIFFVVFLVFFGFCSKASGSSGIALWTNLISAGIVGFCEYSLYTGSKAVSQEELSTILTVWTALLTLIMQGRLSSKFSGNKGISSFMMVVTSLALVLYAARTDVNNPIGAAFIVIWPLLWTFLQF